MQIVPAILAQNAEEFEQKIQKIKNLGFKMVQIDICDGCFVKNKTFYDFKTDLDLELHLMVKNPEEIIKQVRDYKNIKRIIFHFEATRQVNKIINLIKNYNFQVGLAIKPETPVFKIKKYLKHLDSVLIMSVQPGSSGQEFIPETTQKIKELRQLDQKILIEVDGGINKKNAKQIIRAGADVLAIGSCLEKFV